MQESMMLMQITWRQPLPGARISEKSPIWFGETTTVVPISEYHH
jgi:hypothetical protein